MGDDMVSTEGMPHMPKLSCPEAELQKSTRGQTVSATLKNPAAASWSDETPRRMAMERAVLSVREKSSAGFRSTFTAEEEPAPFNEAGRPTTRTAMVAARREQQAAENAHIGRNPRLSLPTGVQPGAPGKTKGYHRFTHHDVERNQMAR